MKRKNQAFCVLACCLLLTTGGCTMEQTEDTNEFDTRTVDYKLAVGLDGELATVLSKVYDSESLVGKVVSTYENGVNTERYVYEVEDGEETLSEYDLYTYETVTYGTDTLYRLTKSEVYNKKGGTLQNDCAVTYDSDLKDCYTSKIFRALSSGSMTYTKKQVCTYVKDTSLESYGKYRTEQYFSYDDTNGWELNNEYAAYYYDADGGKKSELYHVVRSTTSDDSDSASSDTTSGLNEGYYLTQYSRNTADYVFLDADSIYDAILSPAVPTDSSNDGAYTVTTGIASASGAADPFDYDLNAQAIGSQVSMLLTTYSETVDEDTGEPYVLKETYYLYGIPQYIIYYNYASDGSLKDETKYTGGGTALDSKTCYRSSSLTENGTAYTVRETYEYSYTYDQTTDTSKAMLAARQGSHTLAVHYASSGKRKEIGDNHVQR